MTNQQPCPLCEEPAFITKLDDRDGYRVACAACTVYTITGPVLAYLELARQRGDRRDLAELADLAMRTTAEGGELEITTDAWKALARDPHLRNGS